MDKNYYKILNIEKNASPIEIKKAYRVLAKKYHPDVSNINNSEEKFKEICHAYEILKDPKKRKIYDESGMDSNKKEKFKDSRQYSDNFQPNYEDIFTEFLRQKDIWSNRRSSQDTTRDLHAKLEISVKDSFTGITKQLKFSYDDFDLKNNVVKKVKNINVKIPTGIANNQQVRLKGQGLKNPVSGAIGDLYIEVIIISDTRYKVCKNDLYSHIPIAPWEAALGSEITVALPNKKIKLKIPMYTQSGKRIRLKNKGIAGGDLYLILDVILPPATSKKSKNLYEKMSQDFNFDTRKDLLGEE